MKINDFIVILLVVTAIGLVLVDIKNLTGESGKCLKNPMSFGVDKWQKANNQTLQCSCFFVDGTRLEINNETVEVVSPKSNLKESIFNYSKFLEYGK